jgi:hypothetical protein
VSPESTHHRPDHQHPVVIFVNRREIGFPERHATGLEIKERAEVPMTFKLFDPRGDEVANEQRVELREHERFTAISGQDVS